MINILQSITIQMRNKENKYAMFRKNEYFSNPNKYDVIMCTDEGELNISNIISAKDKDKFLSYVKDAIIMAREILDVSDSERNLRYWIAACNHENMLYDSTFAQDHNPFEISDLASWAENEMYSLGFLSENTPALIRSHIDFDGIAEELLSDYEHCELDNGNILAWRY